MWVVFTQHLTYHAGAFLVRVAAGISDAHHSIEYSTVYGLESVTHIRQCAGHDDRH